jgi:brefeldin A-resistance guanine nucleotide exchange factor 1
MEHLTALLSTPQQYSILLVERAVVGLLRLGRILTTKVLSYILPHHVY